MLHINIMGIALSFLTVYSELFFLTRDCVKCKYLVIFRKKRRKNVCFLAEYLQTEYWWFPPERSFLCLGNIGQGFIFTGRGGFLLRCRVSFYGVGEDMVDTWFCFLDKRGFRLLVGERGWTVFYCNRKWSPLCILNFHKPTAMNIKAKCRLYRMSPKA